MAAAGNKWLRADGLEKIRAWKAERLTDGQVAERMGISARTFYNWKRACPEIADALEAGRARTVQEAEGALYKAAFGYSYEETRMIGTSKAGKVVPQRVEKVIKYARPDITALIFLLCNQDPEHWRRNADGPGGEQRGHTKLEVLEAARAGKGRRS